MFLLRARQSGRNGFAMHTAPDRPACPIRSRCFMLQYVPLNAHAEDDDDEDPDPAPNIPQDIKDWIDRHLAEEQVQRDAARATQRNPSPL